MVSTKRVRILLVLLMLLVVSVYFCVAKRYVETIIKVSSLPPRQVLYSVLIYKSIIPDFRQAALSQVIQETPLRKRQLFVWHDDEDDVPADMVVMDKVLVIPKIIGNHNSIG